MVESTGEGSDVSSTLGKPLLIALTLPSDGRKLVANSYLVGHFQQETRRNPLAITPRLPIGCA
jgi:hypothetical protein